MMIKLSCDCHVAADQISEIVVRDNGYLTVRTKDGIGHHVDSDYGKGVYATRDRLVAEVNAAMATKGAVTA